MSTVSDVLESYARDWSIDATPLISSERSPSISADAASIPSESIRSDLACFLEALVVSSRSTQERQSEAQSLLSDIVTRRLTPSERGGRAAPYVWTYGTAEIYELTRREIARRITSTGSQSGQPDVGAPQNRALAAISELASWLGVTPAKAADLAGGYRRSYYNWLKGVIPYDATTLNLFEAHSFVEALVDAIEPRGAREWFRMSYADGTRLDLLRSVEGRAVLNGLVRPVLFTVPESGPEWLPDDELTHTPPPSKEKEARRPRLVQRPQKGFRK